MASDAVTGSIADHVAQTLAAFEAIDMVKSQAELEDPHFVSVQTISDQLSKFKLWAGNIGAHRTGRSSLDYRLRDSSHLHTQVVRLLDNLISSLSEVRSILSGEILPWDQDSGEADELDEELKDLLMNEDFEFDSELEQLTQEIANAIGNLLRLSISLRNPAPHDRFMSTQYAQVRYFEANDKAHAEAKFPKASQTLIVRLGQALSQRRQYFRYRESHHEKLARGLFDSGRSEADAQSTVASSVPLAMRRPEAVPLFGELDEDERSDTGFSQTSFASTAPDSDRLRIPPLPKRSYDGPFECPFCFMLISVSSTYQWRKHVLRDLRPYICLAEDCPAANKEYGRRHEWMNHVLQKHWKSWTCPYRCGLNDTTETNLREHITRVHGSATQMELDAMIARCSQMRSIPSSSPVNCPLCQHTLESIQQYQRHVGRHQVDLALFALPKIDYEEEEIDERDEDRETVSTHSESYSEAMSDDIPPTALAEPTETIGRVRKGEHKAEMGTSELEPLEDNRTGSRDSERFTDESDIDIRVERSDSLGELPHLPPTAKVTLIEREVINHYRDIDHDIVRAERSDTRPDRFVDELEAVQPNPQEELAPGPEDEPVVEEPSSASSFWGAEKRKVKTSKEPLRAEPTAAASRIDRIREDLYRPTERTGAFLSEELTSQEARSLPQVQPEPSAVGREGRTRIRSIPSKERNYIKVYYCCICSHGPWNLAITLHCQNCGHELDGYCTTVAA
ncbi:hypothetical protein F5Y12DRAFT_251198 [Xylaria sp. FL1777]|nr:hypothetical protein F5Y12DRAFT_251198 [Xylaria sp. FL1777]